MRRCRLPMVLLLLVVPLSGQFAPRLPAFQAKADLALLRQSWIEDLEAGRLFGAVGHYAPDATLMNLDGSHADGIAAIRDLYTTVFAHFDASLRMTSRTTGQSADLAYDSGAWDEDLTDRATHASHHLHGDYLTLYHRQSVASSWMIVQQVFTEAPAAP